MVRKTGEQGGGLPGCREHTVERLREKGVLPALIAVGVNASDGDDRFHFQGHSLPSECFLAGKGI
jgi:hypothetical protein